MNEPELWRICEACEGHDYCDRTGCYYTEKEINAMNKTVETFDNPIEKEKDATVKDRVEAAMENMGWVYGLLRDMLEFINIEKAKEFGERNVAIVDVNVVDLSSATSRLLMLTEATRELVGIISEDIGMR